MWKVENISAPICNVLVKFLDVCSYEYDEYQHIQISTQGNINEN
jgi:hypothetical protein